MHIGAVQRAVAQMVCLLQRIDRNLFTWDDQTTWTRFVITSVLLKKARSCIGADRGSGLTRPLLTLAPPPQWMLPLIAGQDVSPPRDVLAPSDLSNPPQILPPLTCFPPWMLLPPTPTHTQRQRSTLAFGAKSLVLLLSRVPRFYLSPALDPLRTLLSRKKRLAVQAGHDQKSLTTSGFMISHALEMAQSSFMHVYTHQSIFGPRSPLSPSSTWGENSLQDETHIHSAT